MTLAVGIACWMFTLVCWFYILRSIIRARRKHKQFLDDLRSITANANAALAKREAIR